MYNDSSRAEMRTDTRTVPGAVPASMKAPDPLVPGLSTLLGIGADAAAALATGAAAKAAAGSDDFGLMLTAAIFGTEGAV